MKKKIFAIVLSAVTIISLCAIAIGSASAANRGYPHEHYRGSVFNNVRINEDTTSKANGKAAFFWP